MIRNHWLWRRLYRDLQVSELRVLVLAVAIAVTAVTSVGFFTDRVGRAMTLRSAEVMAADVVLRSRSLISADYVIKAKTLRASPTRHGQALSQGLPGVTLDYGHKASFRVVRLLPSDALISL